MACVRIIASCVPSGICSAVRGMLSARPGGQLRPARLQANAPEYYKLDQSKPVRTQLPGLVIVEYPTLVVLLPDELSNYKLAEAPSAQPAPPVEPSANPAQATAPPAQPVESAANLTRAWRNEPKQQPSPTAEAPVDAFGLSCDAPRAPCSALASQDTPEAMKKCDGAKDAGCSTKQSPPPAPFHPALHSE